MTEQPASDPQGRATVEGLVERRRAGDEEARTELVERFLPLARRLARRYERSREPLDDLVQVACVGLVKAADRFEPSRGIAFTTYAVPTILGELKRHFRDTGWDVHVPRGLQERVMSVDRSTRAMTGKLGRSPSVPELSAATGLTQEDVLEAIEASRAYDASSLDARPGGEDDDGATVADSIGEEDQRFELIEYGAAIQPTIDALPDRDRLVLRLRFMEDLTQSEIAERVGVSQMQVSRILRRTLSRLRAVAEASEPG